MRNLIGLSFFIAICFSPFATAEELTREKASSLMAECQSQRKSHIAPLKEEAIADCMSRASSSPESCERDNINFGEARHNMPGMFWGLPICEEAISAEKYYKKYPGRK